MFSQEALLVILHILSGDPSSVSSVSVSFISGVLSNSVFEICSWIFSGALFTGMSFWFICLLVYF